MPGWADLRCRGRQDQDPTHENGWDYDVNTNRVTVYGAACDSLKSKQVTEASLVYTCSFEPR